MGNRTTLALIAAIVRTPTFQVAAGAAVVLGVGMAGTTTMLVSNAHSASCDIQKHDDLTIEELISVKKRFSAYKRNPEAGLELSGEELSMLLEDSADVPVFVDIQGNSVAAQVAVPSGSAGRCWPIDFRGELEVEDGVAYVVPFHLTVGEVDLSTLTRGMRMELMPEHMPNARAAFFLEQTRSASIEEGLVNVELSAPTEFSWSKKR